MGNLGGRIKYSLEEMIDRTLSEEYPCKESGWCGGAPVRGDESRASRPAQLKHSDARR